MTKGRSYINSYADRIMRENKVRWGARQGAKKEG